MHVKLYRHEKLTAAENFLCNLLKLNAAGKLFQFLKIFHAHFQILRAIKKLFISRIFYYAPEERFHMQQMFLIR